MKQQKLTFHVFFLLVLNCFLVEKHIKSSFSRLLSAKQLWRELEWAWKFGSLIYRKKKKSWNVRCLVIALVSDEKWICKRKIESIVKMNALRCKLFDRITIILLALAIASTTSGKNTIAIILVDKFLIQQSDSEIKCNFYADKHFHPLGLLWYLTDK